MEREREEEREEEKLEVEIVTTLDPSVSHGSVDDPQQSAVGAHMGSSVMLFYSCNFT